MQHVVTDPTPPFRSADGSLEVHQVPSWVDNLVWIAVCTRTGAAAAVDGPDAAAALAYCEDKGIELTHILNTHTHPDHVGINRDLQRRGQLDSMQVVGADKMASQVPGITQRVDEGATIELGAARARVMLTEGHINGHICFLFDDILFSGDTLFTGGCGFLVDGPPAAMHDSLNRLGELDDAVRVCCAHEYTQDNLRFAWSVEPDNGALADRIRHTWKVRDAGGCVVPSKLGDEKATNPFLRHHCESLRANVAAALPDADLSSPGAVFAATRKLKDMKRYREQGDDILPL